MKGRTTIEQKGVILLHIYLNWLMIFQYLQQIMYQLIQGLNHVLEYGKNIIHKSYKYLQNLINL